jgi:hypothetical protein
MRDPADPAQPADPGTLLRVHLQHRLTPLPADPAVATADTYAMLTG